MHVIEHGIDCRGCIIIVDARTKGNRHRLVNKAGRGRKPSIPSQDADMFFKLMVHQL